MDLVVNLTLLSAKHKPIDTFKQGVTQRPGTLLMAIFFFLKLAPGDIFYKSVNFYKLTFDYFIQQAADTFFWQ